MNVLQLSWKNIINKPLNMALSLILFGLGVGLISLLLVLNKQLQEKFDKNLAGVDLIIGAKGSKLQQVLCSMYHIDNPTGNISIQESQAFLRPGHPLIETAIPLSLGDSYKGYRIVGTIPQIMDLYGAEIGEGKVWEKNMEATLGVIVADKLGLKIGDQFFSSHGLIELEDQEHDHAAFTVTGILKPSGSVIDQLILTNTQSIWAVHEHAEEALEEEDHTGHDHAVEEMPLHEYVDKDITSILLKFKGRSYQALTLGRNIDENTDMQASSPAFEINRLYSMMGVGAQALRGLALVIIIVSGLSIFISLFSSLKERKYELALMRVMGARPLKLFFLIILEGLILAVMGYLLGIFLSHIGMAVLGGFMEDSYRYSFSATTFLPEESLLLLGALGIGFIAAIIPAIQASLTDISTTLTEG